MHAHESLCLQQNFGLKNATELKLLLQTKIAAYVDLPEHQFEVNRTFYLNGSMTAWGETPAKGSTTAQPVSVLLTALSTMTAGKRGLMSMCRVFFLSS